MVNALLQGGIQYSLVIRTPAFVGMETGLSLRLASIRAEQTSAKVSLPNEMGNIANSLRDIQQSQALGIQVNQAYIQRLKE